MRHTLTLSLHCVIKGIASEAPHLFAALWPLKHGWGNFRECHPHCRRHRLCGEDAVGGKSVPWT